MKKRTEINRDTLAVCYRPTTMTYTCKRGANRQVNEHGEHVLQRRRTSLCWAGVESKPRASQPMTNRGVKIVGKLGIVLAGYALAFLLAYAALEIRIALTNDEAAQASAWTSCGP